ncbi:MAG: hypothetical protein LBL50_00940 [Candidatus Margulisbacteria bacterium]|jgi:hypothetical protein|nr:hypothetical protein [Candidatus Margulisiibacteriota bacterium]
MQNFYLKLIAQPIFGKNINLLATATTGTLEKENIRYSTLKFSQAAEYTLPILGQAFINQARSFSAFGIDQVWLAPPKQIILSDHYNKTLSVSVESLRYQLNRDIYALYLQNEVQLPMANLNLPVKIIECTAAAQIRALISPQTLDFATKDFGLVKTSFVNFDPVSELFTLTLSSQLKATLPFIPEFAADGLLLNKNYSLEAFLFNTPLQAACTRHSDSPLALHIKTIGLIHTARATNYLLDLSQPVDLGSEGFVFRLLVDSAGKLIHTNTVPDLFFQP